MFEFLLGLALGLALGLVILCIYAAIVSGSKYDLELETVRLKKELRILKGEMAENARLRKELKMVDEVLIGGKDEKI